VVEQIAAPRVGARRHKGNDVMKISNTLIAAFGLVALAACGSRADENATANMDANMDANMMVTDNMGADNMGMGADANMAGNGMNAADGMNATENAMATDRNTNDPDTNLANGM